MRVSIIVNYQRRDLGPTRSFRITGGELAAAAVTLMAFAACGVMLAWRV